MKIGLFSDTHYCDRAIVNGDRKPRVAFDRLAAALDAFQKEQVSLVVCLGDMINYNGDKAESRASLTKISTLIRNAGIPCVCCMGNHDNEAFNHDDFAEISQLQLSPFLFEDSESRLIFLDASYTPDEKPLTQDWNDWTQSYVPDKQLDWLKQQLNTNKRCSVFIHQILDPAIGDEDHTVCNAEEINNILAQFPQVKNVFQGHYHFGADHIVNAIRYTTLKAMCMGEENRFMIAEV